MSTDQNAIKRSTGTVPKQRNSYTRSLTEVDRLRSLSQSSNDYYNESTNDIRNPRSGNQIMESPSDLHSLPIVQNGSLKLNCASSSNCSSTTSRKNSSTSILKCDNITKHPNKKQIEDKLNEIHEYLKVTNSLMDSIKKTENQMLADNDENAMDDDFSSNILENELPNFQLHRKSENKRLSPIQNRNVLEVCNHIHSPSKRGHRNYTSYDRRHSEPEEKNKKIQSNIQIIPTQDKTVFKTDGICNQSLGIPNFNNRGQPLMEPDFNEADLAAQHVELHKKVVELQNRKFQLDQFIAQVQHSEDRDEDMENDIIKICAMKTQLKKLRDMLEIIKTPQNLECTSNPSEYERPSCFLCSTADSSSEKLKSRLYSGSNTFRSSSSTNSIDKRPKQLNNSPSKPQAAKANISNISQKTTLQAELECKKRELVELMGKHKVNTSNLNQGLDVKSDSGFLTNGINDPWNSVISNDSDSDRFFSDGYQEDLNENIKHNFVPVSPMKCSANSSNCPPENFLRRKLEYQRSNSPEINYCNNSATQKKFPKSISQDLQTQQVQKQIQLIRTMCDSMLEEPSGQQNYSNVQVHQNNQTSSQMYSPSHLQHSNEVSSDDVNIDMDKQWHPSMNNNNDNNISSYYSWFTSNSIQTQSFLLNSLNQCYQMLWMQQKELGTLKNQMSLLQEKLKNSNCDTNNNTSSTSVHAHPQTSPNRRLHPTDDQQKLNQDVYTIPIANQFNCPLPSIPFNYIHNSNSHLMDTCLNNMDLNHLNVHQNTEHGIPTTINQSIRDQIWPGQALNNQVVPGNRANNYWDNFRSYSRQNLLSTKNSEVLQNLPPVLDRSNFVNQCSNPFTFISLSKSNSEQDSSQDNSSQRIPFKTINSCNNLESVSRDTRSDVANINDALKTEEDLQALSKQNFHKENDVHFGLPPAPNLRTNHEHCFNSNIVEGHETEQSKRTDEPSGNVQEAQHSRSTFADLKENIYKEVTSLISANENRPQFLVQLFRDLQFVKSDNARENVLQTIERYMCIPENSHPQPVNTAKSYVPASTSLDIKALSNPSNNNDGTMYKKLFQDIQCFVEHEEEMVIEHKCVMLLKEYLFSTESFREMMKDSSFPNEFLIILENDLQKYYGKRLGDIKLSLLARIRDVIFRQYWFVHSKERVHCLNTECDTNNVSSDNDLHKKPPEVSSETGRSAPYRELAEADQSRIGNEDFVEEGAVGGVTNATQLSEVDTTTISDRTSVCPPNQARSDFTESCQPNGDPEIQHVENNADLFLTH